MDIGKLKAAPNFIDFVIGEMNDGNWLDGAKDANFNGYSLMSLDGKAVSCAIGSEWYINRTMWFPFCYSVTLERRNKIVPITRDEKRRLLKAFKAAMKVKRFLWDHERQKLRDW